MSEHEKKDEENAQAMRKGATPVAHENSSEPEGFLPPMTEMEAAARILAMRRRMQPSPASMKAPPLLQEFAEKARAEGPKLPRNADWKFPAGSPNTLSKPKT